MVLHVCHVYIMYNAYIVYNVIQDCKNITIKAVFCVFGHCKSKTSWHMSSLLSWYG